MPSSGELIETRLKKDLRRFTLNEAASATGVAIDDAREALGRLMEKYDCRLQVTENGDLIYDFGKRLRRRNALTFKDYAREAGERVWKVFVIICKSWIAVTLVVYFVLFVVVLLALIFARGAASQGGGSTERRRRGAGLDMNPALLFYIFNNMFGWRTHTGRIRYNTDRFGYRYREFEPKPGTLNPGKKSFIASVYDFVFGPERVAIDPLANQKEAASFITENKGLLVTSEIVALTGCPFDRAESLLTDLLGRFNGEVEVTPNGVIYAEFDDLLRRLGEVEKNEVIYYWDEFEPEPKVTGNGASRDLLIGALNGFNLIFSWLVLTGGIGSLAQGIAAQGANGGPLEVLVAFLSPDSALGMLFLGWLPFLFSGLFFLMPLIRYFKIKQLQQRRRRNNLRKRVFHVIFKQRAPLPLAEIIRQVNMDTSGEPVAPEALQPVLEEASLDIKGEMSVSEKGELLYSFPTIQRESQEVAVLRGQRGRSRDLGKVILDSD